MKTIATIVYSIIFLAGAGIGYLARKFDEPPPPRPLGAIALFKANSMCKIHIYSADDYKWFTQNTNPIISMHLLRVISEPKIP